MFHIKRTQTRFFLVCFFISLDQSDYENEIANIENYCKENILTINVKKTKEMIIDFCRGKENRESVSLAGESVQIVHTFKYLGTVIDSKLNFGSNTDYCSKRAQQRLKLLRKLSFFNISKKKTTNNVLPSSHMQYSNFHHFCVF